MIAFDKTKAIANRGDITRFSKVFGKLEAGESVTICFLGGSITQGSLSSTPTTCYVYKVYNWFKEKFPAADITYVNAGVGGTTSAFGAARCDRDVLMHDPDMVLVEFSVNDENNEYFLESYEGLIRKLLYSKEAPAVATLFNFYYENGKTAEQIHSRIARYYDIPAASMHGAIYDDILSGKIEDTKELSPDGLHPNDLGHDLLSRVVINLMEAVYEKYKLDKEAYTGDIEVLMPVTENTFEVAKRLDNRSFEAELKGFNVDNSKQRDVTDCFKNGWLGSKKNDKIVFMLDGDNECTGIAVQYDKTMKRPAPVVAVTIDGDISKQVIIDAAFDETWGDLLDIRQITLHEKKGPHKLEVEVIDDKDGEAVPFNLVSVIITG